MQRTESRLAVAYARVSTGDQGLGIEAQLSVIAAWAE
jgi:hypothetical protein